MTDQEQDTQAIAVSLLTCARSVDFQKAIEIIYDYQVKYDDIIPIIIGLVSLCNGLIDFIAAETDSTAEKVTGTLALGIALESFKKG
jgi:hypothetical protein